MRLSALPRTNMHMRSFKLRGFGDMVLLGQETEGERWHLWHHLAVSWTRGV